MPSHAYSQRMVVQAVTHMNTSPGKRQRDDLVFVFQAHVNTVKDTHLFSYKLCVIVTKHTG